MRTFTDNAGRTWTVRVDVAAVKRVRQTLGLDIVDLAPDGGFAKIAADVVTLVDALYVLLRDQAEAVGVTDADFGRALAGDALGAAVTALVDEVVAFFPNRRQREALARLIAAGQTMTEAQLATLMARLESPSFAAELAATSSPSATSSPASSDSTQTPGPSES